ncbi:MAG: PIN domain-containing protein [Longimonas sp.]
MIILFDTNVVLDVLLARDPYVIEAMALFEHLEQGHLTGFITSTTITTVYYVGRKSVGEQTIRRRIQDLLDLFSAIPVPEPVLRSALDLAFTDFEDAVLHEAARQADAEGIVTRNARDFTAATLSVYDSGELLQVMHG